LVLAGELEHCGLMEIREVGHCGRPE
jgi:hypothetical protein